MKTNLLPVQPASAFGAPPSGDPGLVNAEPRTASPPRYLVPKFALLGLLAALCFAASRAQASDGTLVSWGDDEFGQVSGTPTGIFSAVAAGYSHSVGLRTNGTLVSWGWDAFGVVSGTPTGTF